MRDLIRRLEEEVAQSKAAYERHMSGAEPVSGKTPEEHRRLNFWRAFEEPGWSEERILEEMKKRSLGKFKLPANVALFLRTFSKVDGDSGFFGEGWHDFGMDENSSILQLVEQGVFPKFMKRFLPLSSIEGAFLGVWVGKEECEDAEILHFDYEEQSVQVVSGSMENFLKRALECHQAGLIPDLYEPSDEVHAIIESVEEDDVFPEAYEYDLNFTDDYPEHWRKKLFKKG